MFVRIDQWKKILGQEGRIGPHECTCWIHLIFSVNVTNCFQLPSSIVLPVVGNVLKHLIELLQDKSVPLIKAKNLAR